MTLVELVVALAIVSIAAGLAGVAVTSAGPGARDPVLVRLDSARAVALRTRQGVRVRVEGVALAFYPDGSADGGPIITDSVVYRLDVLTGEVRRARR